MESKDVNIYQLETIASALGDLLPRVIFVGGCTTALLVDEAAHFGVRETKDVDVIINVATYIDYQNFSKELRKRGFKEDIGGPICRWIFENESGQFQLDVMPNDEGILGFSNRWYSEAIKSAVALALPSGKQISVVNPPYFIATKFEAFNGRGNGDYFSHDMEDIVFVLENRKDVILELMDSPLDLKVYLAEQAGLLLNDNFLNVLPGMLNNQESAGSVERYIRIMSSW